MRLPPTIRWSYQTNDGICNALQALGVTALIDPHEGRVSETLTSGLAAFIVYMEVIFIGEDV